MLDSRHTSTSRNDQRFTLSLLVLATGFVLTLQNPQAQQSASDLISSIDLPSLSQVAEMRPQSPPPGVEGDQLATDEGQDAQTVVIVDRDEIRSSNLRERPER